MSNLKSAILQYVEAAYLHGLPVENLDTGELEPPNDISEVSWIADSILTSVESALLEEAKTYSNVTHDFGTPLVVSETKAVPTQSIKHILRSDA